MDYSVTRWELFLLARYDSELSLITLTITRYHLTGRDSFWNISYTYGRIFDVSEEKVLRRKLGQRDISIWDKKNARS
jgi:hypothetical protein